MVRMLKEGGGSWGQVEGLDLLLLCILVLASFCSVGAVVLLCADGASKDQDAATSGTYVHTSGGAGGCAAGCGAACGTGCGG